MDTDTPIKAYWYGYISLCSIIDGDEMVIPSKERFHLDSLLSIIPEGDVECFEVETGKRKNDAYYRFVTESSDMVWSKPVRKFAPHVVRGMMDARPAARWDEDRIDVDFPLEQAQYIAGYIPYLKAEPLPNGRVSMSTESTFDTNRLLEYLYRDAPVARPSRRAVYKPLRGGSSPVW